MKSHFLCFISWELVNLIHSWFHLKVDPIWIRLIGKGTCPFSIQRFNSLNFISTWLAEHSIDRLQSISTASAMSLLSVLQGFHTMLTEMIRLLLQRPGKSNFKLTFFAFFLYLGYQMTHIQKKNMVSKLDGLFGCWIRSFDVGIHSNWFRRTCCSLEFIILLWEGKIEVKK